MTDLRARIAAVMPNKYISDGHTFNVAYNRAIDACIDAIMKSAKVVYGTLDMVYGYNDHLQVTDTHSAILFGIQKIEVPDTADKLIEDLAKCDPYDYAEYFVERAKKLRGIK